MSGAVFVRTLQLQHDLAGAITFEPFVGDGRPSDITAELLQFQTLIGAPAQRRMKLKPCALTRSSGVDGMVLLGRLCGRGAQEKTIAELKGEFGLDVVPTRH